MIRNLADGRTELRDLLKQQATAVNQHTHDELEKLEKDRARRAECQTLLDSLKYPRMNERRTQVASSHEKTFSWAYSGMTKRDIEGGSYADSSAASSSDKEVAGPPLAHPFQDWLRDPAAKLYWVSGKPGSGKSTFMKFLVNNERTEKELRGPGKNVRILSHYFWMGGHELQRNIRGMELSLLHQVLDDADHELAGRLLHQFGFLRKKRADTDWSREELDKVLMAAFELSSSSFCIFLDGLDEVMLEDRRGPASIMSLVEQLCGVEKVKICASSRPEPDLQRFFARRPHLRMQDVTYHDIRRYADDSLRRLALVPSDVSSADMTKLLDILCEHAAGVFLWVSLALQSLETGLVENNTVGELSKRLELLPQELDELYSDMWDRANAGDNKKIYREKAALFCTHALNLMQVGKNPLPRFSFRHLARASRARPQRTRYSTKSIIPRRIDVYRYISEPELTDKLLETGVRKYTQAENEKSRQRTRRDIEIRTAGLLQVVNYVGGSREVDFVHRSAIDFLKDTAKGKEIRTHPDPTITPAVVLARAMRAMLVLIFDMSGDVVEKGLKNEITLLQYLDMISRSYAGGLLDTITTVNLIKDRQRVYDRVRHENKDFILEHPYDQLPMDFAGCCVASGVPHHVLSRLPGLAGLSTGGHGDLSRTYPPYLLQVASQSLVGIFKEPEREGAMLKSIEWFLKHSTLEDSNTESGPGHRDFNRVKAVSTLKDGEPSHLAINTAVFHLLQNVDVFYKSPLKSLWATVRMLTPNVDHGNTSFVLCRVGHRINGLKSHREVELRRPTTWHGSFVTNFEGNVGLQVLLEVDVRFYLQRIISCVKFRGGPSKDMEDDLGRLNKLAPPDHGCATVLSISNMSQGEYTHHWMPGMAEAWTELSRAFQPGREGEDCVRGEGIHLLEKYSLQDKTTKLRRPPDENSLKDGMMLGAPLLPYLDPEQMPDCCREVSHEDINQMLCDKGLAIRKEDAVWRPSFGEEDE